MPTHLVNLDALVQRQDFRHGSDEPPQRNRLSSEIKIGELESNFFHLLKKPDFQRTTNNWSSNRIMEFVKSFVDGDLIPSIIMWWSQDTGTAFVIDGAHRMSALAAWVHDDYGDGAISRAFWKSNIPAAQKKLAEATKLLIDREIGQYQKLKRLVQDNPAGSDPVMLARAKNMATFKIDLQWVEGSAETAERSFFRINCSASIIDRTELEIIKSRRKPNAIATRALMNAGTGHRYWSGFSDEVGDEIEKLSKEIAVSLFQPILETPVKTMDLPIAGQGYSSSAFQVVFDLVNQVNGVASSKRAPRMPKERKVDHSVVAEDSEEDEVPADEIAADNSLPDDKDGKQTIAYLNAVKRAALLVSGSKGGSLGLHPVVYYYGKTGRFQSSALLSTIKFVEELKKENRLAEFTQHRNDFEEYLVHHRHFVNSLVHTYGSRYRSVDALVTMYRIILAQVMEGNVDHDKITQKLIGDSALSSLRAAIVPKKSRGNKESSKLSAADRSAAFLATAINGAPRCSICKARLHLRGVSIDHEKRRQDGGTNDVSNLNPTHAYCNSGFKEKKHRETKKKAADKS
jgi:hypothetical protein